jgi:quercetin dioxygenase-like cupin family protein
MSMHNVLQNSRPARALEHDIHITAGRVQITIKKRHGDDNVIMAEYALPPRTAGLPPYVHMAVAKAVYVLDGELSIALDTAVTVAPAGRLLSIPPGVVHSCWNATDTPTRFMVCFASADFRACFDELAALVLGSATNAALLDERMVTA